MTAINVNVNESKRPWASESPYALVEGDAVNFNFNLAWAAAVANDGNLACLIHYKGKDKSSTYLTGSVTATGADNNILSKTTTVLVEGEYVLSVYGTIDGLVRCGGKILLQVQKKGFQQ